MAAENATVKGASRSGHEPTLKDVVAYLCDNYPRSEDLSNARITKMVYLADWKSAIERARQLTGLTWEFNHYGPYVPDVVRMARKEEGFTVETGRNAYGEPRDLIRHMPEAADNTSNYPSLAAEDRKLLDFVINSVKDKNFQEFIKLVYSTYPIVTSDRYSKLDLVPLARDYAEVAPLLG